ncbi:MAG TPA: PH domain-containing protein [Mycobacteriales bacterium]|nr:PH domain-containing protein [Mycobacteriales bacterium]
MDGVDDVVLEHLTVPRMLAVVPALAVAAAVRVLTWVTAPTAVRVLVAGVVAVACWAGYRTLTARLVIGADGIRVRGVFYDAQIPWRELRAAELRPANAGIRLLMWGLFPPHALELQLGSGALRPLAALGRRDDEQLRRALIAIRGHLFSARVPEQRRAHQQERATTSST